MTSYHFSVKNYFSLTLTSDQYFAFREADLLLLRAYIPGIERCDAPLPSADIVIEHCESSDKSLTQGEGVVHIHDTWDGAFPASMNHVLYGVARLHFLKHKLYPVHGACVGNEDGAVLIVGHSGSGKTSLLLHLVQHHGKKVFSGNKTTVSLDGETMLAVAGTPTITIRGSDRHHLDNLNVAEHVERWGRYAFLLDAEKYLSAPAVPIKAVAIVRLNDHQEEGKKLEGLSPLHSLYPFFMDAVNADVISGDGQQVLVGTPPEGTQEHLASNLLRLLPDVPVYSFVGSAGFVAGNIAQL